MLLIFSSMLSWNDQASIPFLYSHSHSQSVYLSSRVKNTANGICIAGTLSAFSMLHRLADPSGLLITLARLSTLTSVYFFFEMDTYIVQSSSMIAPENPSLGHAVLPQARALSAVQLIGEFQIEELPRRLQRHFPAFCHTTHQLMPTIGRCFLNLDQRWELSPEMVH